MAHTNRPVIRFGLWFSLIGVIFIVGLTFFPKEYKDVSYLEAFYYTLRLFILEHDQANFPKSWFLIAIYFMAPLVSVSALGTAINYLFRITPMLRIRRQSDHVLICGVGRTGKLLAETFKNREMEVVGVDSGSPDDFEEWNSHVKIPMIYGDFLSRPILEKAGADRARSILFASGDDLLNLEGVVRAYGWLSEGRSEPVGLWAHIANEKLAATAHKALRTNGKARIRFFDTYHLAAERMVATYFNREVRSSIREVTLIGFGKFGRDLFEVLIKDCESCENFSVRIVDIRDMKKEVDELAGEIGVAGRVRFEQNNISDLHLQDDSTKAFFLCTDDDIGNLSAAMMLVERIKGTYIYVRMTTWPIPAIQEHLSRQRGVTFININTLVVEALPNLPGIFEKVKDHD